MTKLMEKTKNIVELEFTFKTPLGVLFSRLSTPDGLAEWFAEDVNLQGNVYTFIWDKSEHQAEMISMKENKYVRFRWLDNGSDDDNTNYFEFKIYPDEIAGGIALHVTEVIDEDDDLEDATSLWNYQIGELKRNLGM
jgi:uncharacterized protein YndB with AHSA1/START domain